MEYLVYIRIAAYIIKLIKAKNKDVTSADLEPIAKMLKPVIDRKIDLSREDREAVDTILDFLFNRGKDEKTTNDTTYADNYSGVRS